MNHRFLDLTQLEFSTVQISENSFLPLGNIHNLQFLDLQQFVFFAFLTCQKYDFFEDEISMNQEIAYN
jgi:hypothetical protein